MVENDEYRAMPKEAKVTLAQSVHDTFNLTGGKPKGFTTIQVESERALRASYGPGASSSLYTDTYGFYRPRDSSLHFSNHFFSSLKTLTDTETQSFNSHWSPAAPNLKAPGANLINHELGHVLGFMALPYKRLDYIVDRAYKEIKKAEDTLHKKHVSSFGSIPSNFPVKQDATLTSYSKYAASKPTLSENKEELFAEIWADYNCKIPTPIGLKYGKEIKDELLAQRKTP